MGDGGVTNKDATLFAFMADIAMIIYIFGNIKLPVAHPDPLERAWEVLEQAYTYSVDSLERPGVCSTASHEYTRLGEDIPTYVLFVYATLCRDLNCIRERYDITINQKVKDLAVKMAMTRLVLDEESKEYPDFDGLLLKTRQTYAWVYGMEIGGGHLSSLDDMAGTAVSIRDWVPYFDP
jgi:hypothetical protein